LLLFFWDALEGSAGLPIKPILLSTKPLKGRGTEEAEENNGILSFLDQYHQPLSAVRFPHSEELALMLGRHILCSCLSIPFA
jgi:hypothetical protein